VKKNVFFLFSAVLLMLLNLTSCTVQTKKDSDSASPLFAFQDNFDSYSLANPWTPPAGGWKSTAAGDWAIVTSAFSGNGVKFLKSTNTNLDSSYSGTDYTVSAKACPTVISNSNGFGLSARRDSSNNYYRMVVIDDTATQITRLFIFKVYNSGASSYSAALGTFLSTDLNTSQYYTLSLKVSGAVITATATDGTNTKTITWTDPGTTYDPVISSGKAGIFMFTGAAYPVIFDDFTVTVP
jgi:hypothetical protein